jgi:hypothetical protein
MPVYNNEIISEWAAMPSEFDDGWQELGASDKNTILQLMSVDLYLYYLHITRKAYEEFVIEEPQVAN